MSTIADHSKSENNQNITISKTKNSEFYQSQLICLLSSYFLNQAVCAYQQSDSPVISVNVAKNAMKSFGVPNYNGEEGQAGIFSFADYCRAAKENPDFNTSNLLVHNHNSFAHNLLNNQGVDQQNLAVDAQNISTTLEALLGTFAGIEKPIASPMLTSMQFASFAIIQARSPKYAFKEDHFMYPDGSVTEFANVSMAELAQTDPNAISDSLNVITQASSVFEQFVLTHQYVLTNQEPPVDPVEQ
ncbi:MAG: hypothetical protein IJD48_01035 [Clostridia bacterium]|nr:hypothetical protein [Clostridia bacterium]